MAYIDGIRYESHCPFATHPLASITVSKSLVALDTAIRLAILPKPVVLSGLVVTSAAGGRLVAEGRATSVAALLAGLNGVNLAVSELC